jgi:hypothetical protein
LSTGHESKSIQLNKEKSMQDIETADHRTISAGVGLAGCAAGAATGGFAGATAGAAAGGLNSGSGNNSVGIGGSAAIGGIAGGLAGAAVGCAAGAVGALGAAANSGAVAGGLAGTAATTGISDGGGGGGGKVICTELCRNGVIEHDVWMADIRYSRENFSEQTMRGYHSWGVPYVRLMRKYPAFAKIAAKPTQWFAEDIAYRMGVRSKPHLAGWALRELAFRPLCWTLGLVVKARDWQALWRADALPAKSA